MADPLESTAPPSRVNLGPAVPIFRVENLDVSLDYYVERLGFHLEWRSDPLASVGRDRTSIMLAEGDQGQPGTWVWIAAGNVDDLFAELHARGVASSPPADELSLGIARVPGDGSRRTCAPIRGGGETR